MKKPLRFWILSLITFAMLGILGSTLLSSYLVTKDRLIENSLENNKVYAQKLAQLSNEAFSSMQANLDARKTDVMNNFQDTSSLTTILDQILISGKYFNSVSVIDSTGLVLATSPNVGIAGNIIESYGVREALSKKESLITSPYYAATGRLLILVSTPLFNDENEYMGMLNGTIYLHEENFIHNVLSKHYAEDGSYVFVVDKKGILIYHPDSSRIGEIVTENPVVQKLLNKEDGSLEVVNTKGKHMLAGYNYIESSGWGIVSQTPFESSLTSLNAIMLKMFLNALPLGAFFFILAFVLSGKLASPLKKLAMDTLHSTDDKERMEELIIPPLYFEAKQLTETIENYRKKQQARVDIFKELSLTDPLTGLRNRRYSELLFEDLLNQHESFSIILIDIDHFKSVNDEFGHSAGDNVLIFLTEKMLEVMRDKDVCIRLGGEEFAIILPKTDLEAAYKLAEILRGNVESSIPPTNKLITISTGVGEHNSEQESLTDFIQRVDLALYKAKSSGRNKSIISIHQ